MAQQTTRDALRSATLGQKSQFRSKIVEYNGVEFEVRQPDLRSRQYILKNAKDKNGDFDIVSFMVHSVITCTYIPGTQDRVFDESDLEAFLAQNTGGFVEVLGNEVSSLMNVEEENEVKN